MMAISPKKVSESKPMLIDVRTLEEYEAEHLETARCHPIDRLLSEANAWNPSHEVVLICKSGARARQAAERLESVGFSDVKVVDGGLDACKAEGLKTIKGRASIPIYRQVMIAAGVILLIGLGLSLIHPLFLILDAFVAIMLVIGGATGFCPMAIFLSRLSSERAQSCGTATCSKGKNP